MRVAVVATLFLAAAWAVAAPREKAAGRSPAELFRARCSACHDPSRVNHRRTSRDGWREIVYRMQRMPQSGITPAEAETIIDYLAGRRAAATAPAGRRGGRRAFGEEWIAILETAPVNDGRVTIGGRTYAAARDGLEVSLRWRRRDRKVSLLADGSAGATSLTDRWRVGTVTYELHLVLYEVRGETVRIGRALRRS